MICAGAICELPICGLFDPIATQTSSFVVRYGSKSFTTRATDSPAHASIKGRIRSGGLRVSRRITAGEDGQFGGLIEADYGEIELTNNDRQLDGLLGKAYADGRPIELKIGATEIDAYGREVVQPFANFATVYQSVAGEWSFEHDVVRLRIESLAQRLQGRLQLSVYSGSGGASGTASIAGITKPRAFGDLGSANIGGQVVDPTSSTIQFNDGPIQQVVNLYERGVLLASDGDFASYAALTAAGVTPGGYATCLAEGFVRTGAVVDPSAVTADVLGDNGGGYVSTHGAVMKRILREDSDLVDAQLDLASFDALAVLQPAAMGLYLPAGGQDTIEAVLERIAFSCGAVVGQDRTGLFRTLRIDAPGMTADWSFTDRDIVVNGIQRLGGNSSPFYNIPWRSFGVAYGHNYTVQKDADLAAAVTQERRQFLQFADRYAYAQNAGTALRHQTSRGLRPKPCLFSELDDAQTEADRLADLYAYGRAFYEVTVKTALFSVRIGQVVRLTYNAWDLAGGKNFRVIGVEDDAAAGRTIMLVFG